MVLAGEVASFRNCCMFVGLSSHSSAECECCWAHKQISPAGVFGNTKFAEMGISPMIGGVQLQCCCCSFIAYITQWIKAWSCKYFEYMQWKEWRMLLWVPFSFSLSLSLPPISSLVLLLLLSEYVKVWEPSGRCNREVEADLLSVLFSGGCIARWCWFTWC